MHKHIYKITCASNVASNIILCMYKDKIMTLPDASTLSPVINPRRACARVTVVGCVCLCVVVSVCVSVT